LKRLAVGVVAVVILSVFAIPAGATLPGANGKIAFTRSAQLWLMNPDGSGQSLLADFTSSSPDYVASVLSPAWSPDGTRLAVEYREYGVNTLCGAKPVHGSLCSSIAIVDVATGTTEIVASEVGAPAGPSWSPDGTKIAFSNADTGRRGAAIFVMDADGTHVRQLTHSVPTEGVKWSGDLDPTWSPDGKRIAFTSSRDYGVSGSWSIYTVSTDRRPIPTNLIQVDGNDLQPDWSPDGGKILFLRTFVPFPDDRLYTVSADGLVQTELVRYDDAQLPQWAPDGTKIVFMRRWGGIVVMHADGSGVTQITSDGSFPSWQPVP
jgi:Tol biopolymer transport system component